MTNHHHPIHPATRHRLERDREYLLQIFADIHAAEDGRGRFPSSARMGEAYDAAGRIRRTLMDVVPTLQGRVPEVEDVSDLVAMADLAAWVAGPTYRQRKGSTQRTGER